MKQSVSKLMMTTRFTGLLTLLFLVTSTTFANGSIIMINQEQALAGDITPADDPGFPVMLTKPGLYRLNGNLHTNDKAVTAIQILAHDVTIDLNGFTIACTFITAGSGALPVGCAFPGPSAAGDGISVLSGDFTPRRTTVRNGTIRDMGGNGVRVGKESHVMNLSVTDNGRDGIIAGSLSMITGSIANNNGDAGIRTGNFGIVKGNIANNNGGDGIISGGVVLGNTSTKNYGVGILISAYAGLKNNIATFNNGGNNYKQVQGWGKSFGDKVNVCGNNMCGAYFD